MDTKRNTKGSLVSQVTSDPCALLFFPFLNSAEPSANFRARVRSTVKKHFLIVVLEKARKGVMEPKGVMSIRPKGHPLRGGTGASGGDVRKSVLEPSRFCREAGDDGALYQLYARLRAQSVDD